MSHNDVDGDENEDSGMNYSHPQFTDRFPVILWRPQISPKIPGKIKFSAGKFVFSHSVTSCEEGNSTDNSFINTCRRRKDPL